MLLRQVIGNVFRRLRRERGITLRELAELAQVSVPYLSEIERGRKEPSSEILAAICRALDLELTDLLAEVQFDLATAGRATLPPALKIRFRREKHVLREAAQRWLPAHIASRPKKRFVMPFGTPFISPHAPEVFRHLLAPETLHDYGYFDPAAVRRVIAAIRRRPTATGPRAYLERLGLGIALTLVASTQLWHHQFVAQQDVPRQKYGVTT